MEPISVAASIYGLMEACRKVIRFLTSTADAPQSAQTVLGEVQSLQPLFRQLNGLISGRFQQSISRREMIYLDNLVVTLPAFICVFGELDGVLANLEVQEGQVLTVWNKARWAAEEENIGKILRDLKVNKGALEVMLSIYYWFVTRVS